MQFGKNIFAKLQQIPIPLCCWDDFPKEFQEKLFLQLRYYSLKFANQKFASARKKRQKIH